MTVTASTHESRLQPETVMALSDVIRDVAVLKRDLHREISSPVPMGAVSVLSVIERSGSIRVGDIADLLGVDLSVASRHASILDQLGLIERVPSSRDRRSHDLRLTESGEQLMAQIRADATTRLASALGNWTEDELVQLAATLARLRNDLCTHQHSR